ncbi:MAG TPA: SDR family oxidoreductase [Pyrinomonadaceae bacterium]|jgi:NAD(P)-dependent dehydrogenase (short-subunit alcohol dehydrogenase family)|nr:SDR family oxidoreductase [Pyrinomonadaceae bacterium]
MSKTVLITGCSSGFGKATAEFFLAQNWNVIATMRTPPKNFGEIFGDSDRVLVTRLDVTDPDSISRAIDSGIEKFGRIDAVVNNAGIGLLSAMEATPDSTIREVFETNVFGVMAVVQKVIPYMREQRSGTIINVTSNTALTPMPLVSVYAASKTAIEGFSESLAYELSLFNIRVKLVEPGFAPTTDFGASGSERMKGLIPESYAGYAAQLMEDLQNRSAAYTGEQDVAEKVFAAATDESDRLRYPAGADSEASAHLRWTNSEGEYLRQMRAAFASKV